MAILKNDIVFDDAIFSKNLIFLGYIICETQVRQLSLVVSSIIMEIIVSKSSKFHLVFTKVSHLFADEYMKEKRHSRIENIPSINIDQNYLLGGTFRSRLPR